MKCPHCQTEQRSLTLWYRNTSNVQPLSTTLYPQADGSWRDNGAQDTPVAYLRFDCASCERELSITAEQIFELIPGYPRESKIIVLWENAAAKMEGLL